MQSFGIWYKTIENAKEEPILDLHINFWSLEHTKTKGNVSVPYLDVGISIENFREIEWVIFHCPFILNEEEVVDLSDKMIKQENAANIFNEDCEIITTDKGYTLIRICPESADKTDYLVFPFNQERMSGAINVVRFTDFPENGNGEQTNFNIEFSFLDLIKAIQSSTNSDLKTVNRVYLRFRIKADLLKNLYFDSEPLNKSFESAFEAARIIDFQVNKKRSISAMIKHELDERKLKWPNIRNVHFLLMEPSAHIVEALSSNQTYSCRNLEVGIWNDYLENTISSNDMLAYHWKVKAKDDAYESDYSCLIRVKYSKTNKFIIAMYCLVVVVLGALGSLIASILLEILPFL